MKWVKQYRKKSTTLSVIRKKRGVLSKVKAEHHLHKDSKMKKHRKVQEASEDKAFFMCNGASVRSVSQLLQALKDSGDDVFLHHVNDGKNDFSQWITDVLHDKTLASSLKKPRICVSSFGLSSMPSGPVPRPVPPRRDRL